MNELNLRNGDPMDASIFRIEVVNRNIKVNCKSDENVLHAIEHQASGKFMVGCRFGGCGFCRCKVVEGSYQELVMSKTYISEEDQREHIVLACRITPTSDLKIHYLGQTGKMEDEPSVLLDTAFDKPFI